MSISGGYDDGRPMMEMNTTPLIDVMLVLLIMFIITIPIQTHAVKIDLPVDNPDDPNEPPPIDPVKNRLGIDKENRIIWNGIAVSLEQLGSYLRQTKSMNPEPELQFQPDPKSRYVVVDRVLAEIRRSGATKFGFVGNEQYKSFGKARTAEGS